MKRFRHLVDILKSMDVTIDEKEIAMAAVLNGLPSKYDHFIVAMDALGDDSKVSYEFVKSRLLQEEQRTEESQARSGANERAGEASRKHGRETARMFCDSQLRQ
jgi:hypothetical protein